MDGCGAGLVPCGYPLDSHLCSESKEGAFGKLPESGEGYLSTVVYQPTKLLEGEALERVLPWVGETQEKLCTCHLSKATAHTQQQPPAQCTPCSYWRESALMGLLAEVGPAFWGA